MLTLLFGEPESGGCTEVAVDLTVTDDGKPALSRRTSP